MLRRTSSAQFVYWCNACRRQIQNHDNMYMRDDVPFCSTLCRNAHVQSSSRSSTRTLGDTSYVSSSTSTVVSISRNKVRVPITVLRATPREAAPSSPSPSRKNTSVFNRIALALVKPQWVAVAEDTSIKAKPPPVHDRDDDDEEVFSCRLTS